MALTRSVVRMASALCLATMLTPACQETPRPLSSAAAKGQDFHKSDPKIIGATGRPQVLEFFGVT